MTTEPRRSGKISGFFVLLTVFLIYSVNVWSSSTSIKDRPCTGVRNEVRGAGNLLFQNFCQIASIAGKHTIHLRRLRTSTFFRPASRTVGFSLRFKKFWSRDNNKFFVALRFAKHRSCNAILVFPTDWLSHVSPFFVEVQRKERCPL